MRITILAFGSRGDVQPYVALGLGLQRAGHKVRLVATDDFESFVSKWGLEFSSLGFDIQRDVMDAPLMRAAMESGRNTARAVTGLVQLGLPMTDMMLEKALEACQDAEIIIGSTVGLLLGHPIAEKLRRPFFIVNPFLTRTRSVSNPLFPFCSELGGAYNLLTHSIVEQVLWLAFYIPVRRWRRSLGLPALSAFGFPLHQINGQPVQLLYGHSPHVIPKPPDWGEHIHVTGYWFLDHSPDWSPPHDLLDFMADGPPPVYIGLAA